MATSILASHPLDARGGALFLFRDQLFIVLRDESTDNTHSVEEYIKLSMYALLARHMAFYCYGCYSFVDRLFNRRVQTFVFGCCYARGSVYNAPQLFHLFMLAVGSFSQILFAR